MQWSVSGTSVIGAEHVRRGVLSQDFVIARVFLDDTVAVVAAADGHGGDRHFRSATGSRLGCEVFVEQVLEHLGPPPWPRERIAALDRETPTVLVRRWTERVLTDIDHRPFDLDEPDLVHARESLARRDHESAAAWAAELVAKDDDAGHPTRVAAYGSTLLGFVLTSDAVWWFQLGDGNLVEAGDARRARLLCQPHSAAFADATPSLCTVGAGRYVRSGARALDPSQPLIVAAVTDGFTNSFEHEQGMLDFFDGALSLAYEHGSEALHRFVPRWLSEMTVEGSGDDVTLAWAIRSGAPRGARS